MLAAHLVAKLAKSTKTLYCKKTSTVSSSQQPKGRKTGFLFTVLLIYLIGSRVGPVVFRVGSRSLSDSLVRNCRDCLLEEHIIILKQVLKLLRATTRAPGLLTRSLHSYSSLTLTIELMGNNKSKSSQKDTSEDKQDEHVEESTATPSTSTPEENGSKPQAIPSHVVDDQGHVRGKKGSIDSGYAEIKRLKEMDRNPSTQSVPAMSTFESQEMVTVKFKNIENSLETGDLAILYRHGQSDPHFAIFVNHSECDKHFPLLFIKGKTKPMELKNFKEDMREVRVITAVTRIFYGDYENVAIRRLRTKRKMSCATALKIAEEVESIPYTQQELMFITEASSPELRSRYVCTFLLAHVYHKLDIMLSHPRDITPDNFQDALPLSEPVYIKLPPIKPGPLITGEPPLLAQIAKGMRPSPQKEAVAYTKIRETLQTGDLVLFSGATSSGALIKIFDGAIFSHVGIVLRPRYSSYVMVWESSTNKAGLVDVDSGAVRKGVELLPLRNKIFSGWYDHVAIRKLTGISQEKRDQIYDKLLEVRNDLQGVPYEKNHLELILSAIDVDEKYLTFLRNHAEDLSSIFCSELIAHAYQEIGILDKSKFSNEYTPDDFSTHKNMLTLLEGTLEPEVYIDLNFDYEKETYRQTSIPVSQANKLTKH